MTTSKEYIQKQLESLRIHYIEKLPKKIQAMLVVFESLEKRGKWSDLIDQLHLQAHTLRGSCSSFGLLGIARKLHFL